MRFELGTALAYRIAQPTPFIFNLQVAENDRQRLIEERLTFSQPVEAEHYRMPETGNRYLRVVAQPGDFQVDYAATVELDPLVEDPGAVSEIGPADLPLQVIPHFNPSRFCQSDTLRRFAGRQFGGFQPGHERVTAVCNWIHDNVDYLSGSTDAESSAVDVITSRAGVCRDFAHLAIALCRALGIPARYATAYAWQLEPPDFHAVMECFLLGPTGPRWYLFDATRKAALDGLVRIGLGRDASDIPFAFPFGEFQAGPPKVWIKASSPADPGMTAQAISLSAV